MWLSVANPVPGRHQRYHPLPCVACAPSTPDRRAPIAPAGLCSRGRGNRPRYDIVRQSLRCSILKGYGASRVCPEMSTLLGDGRSRIKRRRPSPESDQAKATWETSKATRTAKVILQVSMMKPVQLTCAVISIGLLVGCGGPPSYAARVDKLSSSGQCDAAESEVTKHEYNLGRRAALIGGIAADCRRDKEAFIRYLTLSARYGEPFAQQELTRMGLPVPSADLKGRDTTCVYYGRVLSCSSD